MVSILKTGLEALRLRPPDYERRKVWDFLGLVPSATELRARRLQRYQDLMKDPTAHQNVLLSFFGEAPFDANQHAGGGGSAKAGRRG